ncbi:CGNR zinc finger domain-containing protein [Streptomyces monticola]|uniref:CGNR zinc finger domain-containing protein n=1 Tax=Streptomyces monticola TaxID=2666263 RepID=A0ABW2JCJ9_9ACTN
MSDAQLALALALTIRHDGHGGIADGLADPEGLTRWVREQSAALTAAGVPAAGFTADAAALTAVRELRQAVRALFARAVRPQEPSPADARRLLPLPEALARLDAAAARVPVTPRFTWPADGDPVVRHTAAAPAPPADLLVSALARAAMAFLASPGRAKLRACHAPRCVLYFLKEHPRQEWCKPSCGNRARVARHHERHRS